MISPMQKILLIEDNKGDVGLIKEMMRDFAADHTLITADRLSSGLELLEREACDLVLLDLGLPDSSGIDTLRAVRNKGPELPIIVLTGFSDEELATRAIGLGAQDYLIKGQINGDLLLRSIRYAIERKGTEGALRESETRLRGIASTALDAVILIDSDGNVSFWNDAATRMFGYTREEMTGKYLHSYIMPERHTDRFKRGFEAFRLTGEGPFIGKVYETDARRKDGTEFPVELSLAALQLKGKWNAVGIVRDITERKRMEEEIRHLAHHDELTGLPNKRLFMEVVKFELAQAQRNERKLAILFLDLDRFKEVNDTLGHGAGDSLLKEVAGRLKASVRKSDTVARIGGDEFNILLSDISRVEDITTIARKVMSAFQRPFLAAGHEFHVTTSIGISIYPDDSEEIETLFRYADIAMYHAKERGRNSHQFYNSEINIRSVERMKFESYLRRTIEREELSVYYQPQVDIKSGHIVCAEALVRWRHPKLGLLPSKLFIPAAEKTGFITTIDEWVMRTACAQFKEWQEAGHPSLCVTVNLSARGFQNPDLVATIARILEETGLPPYCLDIEITESTAMYDIDRTITQLNELTAMGVRISIDDFGTGYSSLSYLKRLPIQRLKIDRSFVKDITTDPDDRAIIKAVTAMAHNMKMTVVAEGVETREQLNFLHETQCDEAQGYFYSKPLPPEEFSDLIASKN
ncbi:MAG TPA: EAL domain-containing protein [Dissulfurispiraceae bacterium]